MKTKALSMMCMLILGTGITAQASTLKAEALSYPSASVPTPAVNDEDLEQDRQELLVQLETVCVSLGSLEGQWNDKVKHKGNNLDTKNALYPLTVDKFFNGSYAQMQESIADLRASINAAETAEELKNCKYQIDEIDLHVRQLQELVYYMIYDWNIQDCITQMDNCFDVLLDVENYLFTNGIPKTDWGYISETKDRLAMCWGPLYAADSQDDVVVIQTQVAALVNDVRACQDYANVLVDNWIELNIEFANETVKRICVEHWDENGDGELSRREAAMVTDIGTYFRECEITTFNELQYFTDLKSIPDYAFENCGNLTSVTIPNNVKIIGVNAFAGCNLETLSMTSKVESIGDGAFSFISDGQVDVSISCAPDHPVIADNLYYDQANYCPAIKSVLLEKGITSIGGHAFEGCTKMTGITIPTTVAVIVGSAFHNCESLTSINIPKGVTQINEGLLFGCSSLTEVTIPEGVTAIWAGAFNNCSALTHITIPSTVTSIGQTQWGASSAGYAFYDNTESGSSLQTIEVKSITPPELIGNNNFNPETYAHAQLIVPALSLAAYQAAEGWENFQSIAPSYDFVDGQGVVYNYEQGYAVVTGYRGTSATVTIPESITVGETRFIVQEIGEAAFQNTNLRLLKVTTALKAIDSYAFVDSSHQNDSPTVTVSIYPTSTNSVVLGSEDNYYTYWNAFGILSVNVCEGITAIAKQAFLGCKTKNVTIESTVITIGESAFYGCNNLENVNLYQGVQTIGFCAFNSCEKLTNINLPQSVTTIGSAAFHRCKALTRIMIPQGVTALNSQVFDGCESLTQITIPTTVRTIHESAFYNSGYKIEKISIYPTNDETTIADRLFKFTDGCFIKRLELQDGITEIGEFAFWGCQYITNVTLPKTLQKIADYAFQGCHQLNNLEIPKSVASIGDYAFDSCTGLLKIRVHWNTPLSVTGNPFPSRSDITLTIPFGTLEAYQADDYWKDFILTVWSSYIDENGLEYYVEPANLTASVAFNKDKELDVVNILESFTVGGQTYQVTSIIGSAWIWDLKLVQVTIPKTVTTIGYQAFNNCQNLTDIVVYATTPPTLGSEVFDSYSNNILENAWLYVPKGTVEAYRSAWGFTHIFEIGNGDASGDGLVNIDDAIAIVNYILGNGPANFIKANADMNGDGDITISDAAAVVNKILN